MEAEMKLFVLFAVIVLLTGCLAGEGRVEIQSQPDLHKVNILVDGNLFTSYCYGPEFGDKPILYPLLSLEGQMVNRKYPMGGGLPGESDDHPHHESVFFTYGEVNGYDFWSGPPEVRIVHRKITRNESGETGLLHLKLEWLGPDNEVVLYEEKKLTFGGSADSRWVDQLSILTAAQEAVDFGDTKEGMFAIRVADELREKGGTGRYLNAYGWETAKEVWGKRAPWVALLGKLNDEELTLAIFDHPTTENHPSYWHARDYGLFSVNPLGRKDFLGNVEPRTRTLPPGESFQFRYRIVVYSGKQTKRRLDEDYWNYIK